jgi:hypothetical protein
MRYRFLFSFLKSSLLTKGISKIRLFLNVAIFLSVFAISSTLISIYYESKITQIEKKIAENDLLLDILSVSTLAIPGKVLGLENISNDVTKNNDILNYFYFSKIGQLFDEYELYYRPVIALSNYLGNNFDIIEKFDEVVKLKNDKLLINIDKKIFDYIKQNSKNHEDFLKIKDEINKDHKKFKFEKGVKVIDRKNLSKYQNYFDKYKIFIEDQLNHFAALTGMLQVIHNNIKNDNLRLYKEISNNSKESKKFIILAFFFQLIIFLIVQAMEIITTRREIQKIK